MIAASREVIPEARALPREPKAIPCKHPPKKLNIMKVKITFTTIKNALLIGPFSFGYYFSISKVDLELRWRLADSQ